MNRLIQSTVVRTLLYTILMVGIAVVGYFILPASVVYHVEERYTFDAGGNPAVVGLGLILPKSGPYQTIDKLQIDWTGNRQIQDEDRVQVLQLEGAMQAGEHQEAVVAYEAILRRATLRWDAPVEDYQLRPQPDIESSEVVLVSKSGELAKGNSRQDALAIYSFVSGYLNWPVGSRIGGSQSALAAYQTRIGGCGEFANLMVALCRASGIPAQTISGIAFPEMAPFTSQTRQWNHPGGAHAWVEVHTEAGWEMADPSWGSGRSFWMKPLYFGRSDGVHLAYAEAASELSIYADLEKWAEGYGDVIGAMTAPLKFFAAANTPDVKVTPVVTVRKGWDGRWFHMIGLILVVAIPIRLLENRMKRARKAHGQ